jgi:uncharacterized protein (DUF58 family)
LKREIVFDESFLEALKRIEVAASEPSGGRLEGARVGRDKGAGIEFADWRPYAEGDNPREIDWRAFARLGRLYVRLRAREEASNVYVLVDASASMDFGRPTKFTFARRIAGALAATALAGLDEVAAGFVRGSACELSPRATGINRLPELLRFLEDGTASGETDLRAGVGGFLDGAPSRRRGVLILISDLWSEVGPAPALVAARERGFEGSLVQVLAPAERDPPAAGRERMVDAESGVEVEIELSAAAAGAYREEQRGFLEEIRAGAAKAGFRVAELVSDRSLEDAVLVDLRRAGVVT